jgi:hypothetical protein
VATFRTKITKGSYFDTTANKSWNVEPSNSPQNSPIFVIEKKAKGKYRLIHDLRAINKAMQSMGALHPGLPSPAMIPEGFAILIIDLKDCFFTIPLHDNDKEKFAFMLPSINNEKPAQRYQWKVLLRGMKNSPTICQAYVHATLITFYKNGYKLNIFIIWMIFQLLIPYLHYYNRPSET